MGKSFGCETHRTRAVQLAPGVRRGGIGEISRMHAKGRPFLRQVDGGLIGDDPVDDLEGFQNLRVGVRCVK